MRTVLLPLLALFGGLAQAQIFITNWEVTDTSVSFDLRGNVTVLSPPPQGTNTLYIGAPGNDSWINTFDIVSINTGTIDGEVASFIGVINRTGGDFLSMGTQLSLDVDFTDGGMVSLSYFYQGGPGSFDPGAIDPSDLIVVWGTGASTDPPDPTHQIGRYAEGLVIPDADVELEVAPRLAFKSLPDRQYSILSSADVAGPYASIAVVDSQGTETVYVDTRNLPGRQFYRVELLDE